MTEKKEFPWDHRTPTHTEVEVLGKKHRIPRPDFVWVEPGACKRDPRLMGHWFAKVSYNEADGIRVFETLDGGFIAENTHDMEVLHDGALVTKDPVARDQRILKWIGKHAERRISRENLKKVEDMFWDWAKSVNGKGGKKKAEVSS